MAACPSCGVAVPEAARFCPSCGTRVGGPLGEERKVVTVLFADLVDSTASADARDPEDVRAALRPHLARMRAELERFGGTFEKYVGDAVMAVFGAPATHEDDPERAVRAALAIRDGIPGVRVAVSTGEAVVSLAASSGTAEGIATGDVVNTAFRIEEAADADTVLVGEPTYRATQGAIEYGERRLLQAKGKSEPLAVYEALRAGAELRPAYDGPPLAPLVGRKEELSLVLDTISRAKRARTVQLVTLIGVPGIGKSRLVWELQRALADEPGLVTWRRGRCLPYGEGVTYWALGEMVKRQAGILESDGAAAASAKLRRAVRDLLPDASEAGWVEGHLRPLLGLGGTPAGGRDEAFAAWRRFFEAIAEWGPVVLVFEDLHWADDGMLDFVENVADWATQWPLVLLCTARPELHERRPTWGARPNAATIQLPPLDEEETGSLVGYLLSRRSVPPSLGQALRDRAGGNPLYAEEFVRMLVDRGLLYRVDEGWELGSGDLPVPESVHAIIAARIDGLPPQEKAVLRDASVVGRGFWPKAVAAVAGAPASELEGILRSLERKELVRRLGSSAVAGDPQYSFHHALVRDVAYSQIPRAGRSRKHLLAAAWIESLGRRSDHAETLAHHYLAALDHASAGGVETSEFAEQARTALREAGDRALSLNASPTAARFYEGALGLWPAGDRDRPQVLFAYGKALARTASPSEPVLEEARDALVAAGEVEHAAECDVVLGELLWRSGRPEAAFERLRSAVDRLDARPPSYSKAYAMSTLSRFLIAADENEAAVDLGRAALALAEQLGLEDLRANALNTMGVARAARGDRRGLADIERSIEIAVDAGSSESTRGYFNLGSMEANFGDLRRAAELHATARSLAERYGDAAWTEWLDAEHVYQLYWQGAWTDALELADTLLDRARSGAPGRLVLDGSLVHGWIALARGDIGGAVADADRAYEFSRIADDPQNLYPALAFRARALVAAGRTDEASRAIDVLLGSMRHLPSLPSFWVLDLVVALDALGRTDELGEVAAVAPPTRWLDAALAFARGDAAEAATICAAIGTRPDEAYVRLIAAERAGDGRATAAPESAAVEFFREVGARAYIGADA